MRKLNMLQTKWILREMRKGEVSPYKIAKQQRVSIQWVHRLHRRFEAMPLYKVSEMHRLKQCGRKPLPVTKEERNVILETKKNLGFGAVMIERVLDEKGIHMPHNRIQKVLLQEGLARHDLKKSRRRKWIRYERRHSNSLWHTDWMEYKRKWYIFYEDDSSRYITGAGGFTNATTENSIKVFDEAVDKCGVPKQVLTDHGTQFCQNEDNTYKFREHLKSKKVKHILARIKHPQTNGKVEKLNHTMQGLLDRFGNLQDAVKFYNEVRPHMSLDKDGHLRTPLQAFNDKKRKE